MEDNIEKNCYNSNSFDFIGIHNIYVFKAK